MLKRKHRIHPEPGYGNFFRTIYKFDEKQLKEELKGNTCLTTDSEKKLRRVVKSLKFGKRIEAFAPIYQDRYTKTLELMAELKVRGVAVNKFLSFDSYINIVGLNQLLISFTKFKN